MRGFFRGYVYDHETQLYYLQSRYYDPQTRRFLNSDIVYDTDAGLQGYNLFIYCGNNPKNRIDASGFDSEDDDTAFDSTPEEEALLLGPGGKGGTGYNGTGHYESSNTGNGKAAGIGYTDTVGLNSSNNVVSNFYTFKSEGALVDHYERHNPEMGYMFLSPQEYLQGANEVIQFGTYLPEYNAYVDFYNYWGGCNYLFVGMTHDGSHITTFHIRNAHKIWE